MAIDLSAIDAVTIKWLSERISDEVFRDTPISIRASSGIPGEIERRMAAANRTVGRMMSENIGDEMAVPQEKAPPVVDEPPAGHATPFRRVRKMTADA